jgi:hypothetical protein
MGLNKSLRWNANFARKSQFLWTTKTPSYVMRSKKSQKTKECSIAISTERTLKESMSVNCVRTTIPWIAPKYVQIAARRPRQKSE